MENDEGIKRNNESKQSGEGDTECRDTDDTCATKESEKEQQAAGWTTRKKLVGASLCIVLFTAFASMSIISPFFPNEVSSMERRLCFVRPVRSMRRHLLFKPAHTVSF